MSARDRFIESMKHYKADAEKNEEDRLSLKPAIEHRGRTYSWPKDMEFKDKPPTLSRDWPKAKEALEDIRARPEAYGLPAPAMDWSLDEETDKTMEHVKHEIANDNPWSAKHAIWLALRKAYYVGRTHEKVMKQEAK